MSHHVKEESKWSKSVLTCSQCHDKQSLCHFIQQWFIFIIFQWLMQISGEYMRFWQRSFTLYFYDINFILWNGFPYNTIQLIAIDFKLFQCSARSIPETLNEKRQHWVTLIYLIWSLFKPPVPEAFPICGIAIPIVEELNSSVFNNLGKSHTTRIAIIASIKSISM